MLKSITKWVLIGGFILSFFAGMINSISLLSFHHQSVSHVTGSVSQFAIFFDSGEYSESFHVLGVIFSFMIGAMLSGIIIRDAKLRFGKRYGIAIMVESLFIVVGIGLYHFRLPYADNFIGLACGLQNALATTYSGAILRTTHMTGIVTDIGILIGHYLRRLPVSIKRLQIYLSLLSGFVFGGLVGISIFNYFRFYTLWIPATALFVTGFSYTTFRLKTERQARLKKEMKENLTNTFELFG